MKANFFLLLITTAGFVGSGCDSASPLLPENELLVVRAYLYTGEPVTDVQLTSTFELTSSATNGQPINDAKVALEKAGRVYPLTASQGDSGYYHYAGNDLVVRAGDRFKITVEYNGQIVTGETIIPSPPRNLTISHNEFWIDNSASLDTSSITLAWEGEETFYFVTMENLETSPTPIDQTPSPDGPRGERRSFRSRPMRESSYRIHGFDLTHYGEHRARVYKVNPEYANLYAFGLQDSRHLNEPATNIQNGLGVFAGFSSAEVRFRVAKR